MNTKTTLYYVKRAIVLILLVTSIWAEKIKLKDGGVIRGKIVSETATELVIANQYGNITIEKKNIAKRVREKTDNPSFKNSSYSFKKRSWPKYAFFATVATGIITSAVLADPGYALISTLSFTGVGLTFIGLDYFRYGRTAKKVRRRWTSFHQPRPVFNDYSHDFNLNSLYGANKDDSVKKFTKLQLCFSYQY